MDGPGSPEIEQQGDAAYVPLWCKSGYSFLEGASQPDELIGRARSLGIPALALTDRNGLYGMVRAHVAAREAGIGLIVGSELTIADPPLPENLTVLLLAQSGSGYTSLCRLISLGRRRNPKGLCSATVAEICDREHDLLVLLAREGWSVPLHAARRLRDAFGDRLYGIVSRHGRPEDPEHEAAIRALADAVPFSLVAATEVLYHEPERRVLQDVMTCIRLGTSLDRAGSLLEPNAEHALQSGAAMRRRYRDAPELLDRTREIASRCSFSLDGIRYRYPSEHVPEGTTSSGWLRSLTLQGACKRYGSTIPANVRAQLDKELDLIEELDYSGYFLTMWNIVEFCRSQGILCQGRGSAANSAVCYCLGITAVDPVRMELLFERFLSRERAEPPDIDLDIEHERREEVIRHMYDTYGRDRAAMVANFIRYRGKSAVRDVGKALGYPLTVLDRLARLLPLHDEPTCRGIRGALEREGMDVDLERLELLVALATEIQGFPRHLSIHPGGFLLGSVPVSDIVPLENATMPGRTVIQWDKEDIEDMGLFKVDLLGLGALSLLRGCFDLLDRHLGLKTSMADIPPDDRAVYDMLEKSDTVGVFQLESRAQMSMLPRLKPRNYYDIVVEVSIVRPGPISGGMVHPYLRRRNGQEEVSYPHPCLEPVLKKTLGIPLFQEQVMKLAVLAADYSPGEADQLRRDMAAWRSTGRIEKHHERLVGRMARKGIAPEFAERIFEQIRGFGEYGFPESHAASFSLIAYATAWLKCHYPVAFACALLNAWPMGFYAPATIVEDAKRHGIRFLPVDAMASDWDCTLVTDGGKRHPALVTADSSLAVRMGLRWVKGMAKSDYGRVLKARDALAAHGEPTLADFVTSSRLGADVLDALAQAGGLCCFGVSRREALWEAAGDRLRRESRDPPESTVAVDNALDATLDNAEILPEFPGLTDEELIAWDHAATSHSTTAHALEPYRQALRDLGLPQACELLDRQESDRVSYAGLVICRQRPATANGVVFGTLEDESGFVNLVIGKRAFERFRTLLLTRSLLGVTGRIEKNGATVYVTVETCWVPRLTRTPRPLPSRDFR